jgi:hypothetical protein
VQIESGEEKQADTGEGNEVTKRFDAAAVVDKVGGNRPIKERQSGEAENRVFSSANPHCANYNEEVKVKGRRSNIENIEERHVSW